MIYLLEAACGSNQGRVRSNHEDNFYFNGGYMQPDNAGLSEVIDFRHLLKTGISFAVFDGMGGGDYGEIASFLAAEYMKEIMEAGGRPKDVSAFLKTMCLGMNQRIVDKQEELNNYRIGSTVAGLYFSKQAVYSFNLGDSKIYRLRDCKFTQLSKNHTDEQFLEENGIKGRRPRLLQHLGIHPEELQLEPYIVKHEYKRGDTYLICSDGLTDMVSDSEIAEILNTSKSMKTCAEKLIQTALEYGGKDNVTVIPCQIN